MFFLERNNELAKLHLRCYSDTQILAHVREKEFMLDNIIAKDTLQMNIISYEVTETRNYANKTNVERDAVRKEYFINSLSCGLLKKPKLLSNYDLIDKNIGIRKESIQKLRKQINKMKEHIKELTRE